MRQTLWLGILAALLAIGAQSAEPAKPTAEPEKEATRKETTPAVKPTDWDTVLGASEKPGTFYGRGEAVFLFRDVLGGGDAMVGYDWEGTGAIHRLNQIDTDIVPGMRLTMGYQVNKRWSVEGSYLGLHGHSGSDSFGYTNGQQGINPVIAGPINLLTVFTDAALYNYQLDTMLHSGELTARYTMDHKSVLTPTIDLGLRYVDISEDFRWDVLDSYPTTDPMEMGTIKSQTSNRLFGPQFGADLTFRVKDWITLSLKPKVGLMANFAEETMSLNDPQSMNYFRREYHPEDRASDTHFSFLAEVGAYANFKAHKHVDVRVGYQALFLTGMALAGDQKIMSIDQRNNGFDTKLRADSTLLYHGPSVGLTVKF